MNVSPDLNKHLQSIDLFRFMIIKKKRSSGSSLWITLDRFLALPGAVWLFLWQSLALYGPLWFTVSLGLSQALIGSQGAVLYSALVAIMHFGDLSPKRGMSQIISITQNYIIAKWLNITLFGYKKGFLLSQNVFIQYFLSQNVKIRYFLSRNFKIRYFCRETLKYALRENHSKWREVLRKPHNLC